MEGWVDLLDEVAHDLKQPIASAKGFVDLVRNLGPLNEKQQHYSERALASLHFMEGLVDHLLDLAWIEADRPLKSEPLDVRDLIDTAIELLEPQAASRQIEIAVEVAPRLGKVQGESRRLEQVVINLLSNAIKYNREAGTVWIKATGTKQEVRVSVRDTGQGIAYDEQPRIFERFFRTRASRSSRIEGSGLGLSIVKGIIEKHGGQIAFESTPGEGTTFTFTLPRRAARLPAIAHETAHDIEEPTRDGTTSAEGTDYVIAPVTGERSDAVDDNLQEPAQSGLADAADNHHRDYDSFIG